MAVLLVTTRYLGEQEQRVKGITAGLAEPITVVAAVVLRLPEEMVLERLPETEEAVLSGLTATTTQAAVVAGLVLETPLKDQAVSAAVVREHLPQPMQDPVLPAEQILVAVAAEVVTPTPLGIALRLADLELSLLDMLVHKKEVAVQ